MPRRLMPAVSMRMISLRPQASRVSMASRVVPGVSETIARSSPSRALSRLDLPTFGRPTNAIEAGPVSASAAIAASQRAASADSDSSASAPSSPSAAVAFLWLVDDERFEPSGRDLVRPRFRLGLARLARRSPAAFPAAGPRRSRRAGRPCRGRATRRSGRSPPSRARRTPCLRARASRCPPC